MSWIRNTALKISTNEKTCGLKVVAFDGSPFAILAEIFKEIGAGPILWEA
jgi:hypothetical protein